MTSNGNRICPSDDIFEIGEKLIMANDDNGKECNQPTIVVRKATREEYLSQSHIPSFMERTGLTEEDLTALYFYEVTTD
jgi:hypothetical protein